MLPSTGLFKSYVCPYYDGTAATSTRNDIETGVTAAATCHRPYCHFRHVRKEVIEKKVIAPTAAVQSAPEYKATPKLLALPLPELSLPSVLKKKTKLEYQPEKPAINASPSIKRKSLDSAPVYIPAPTTQQLDENSQESVNLDLDDCNDELNELTGIIENDNSELAKFSDEDESLDCNSKEIEKDDSHKNKEEQLKKPSSGSESSDKDKHKRRDSSTSSHSSSRHKHHKSSSRSKETTDSSKTKKEDDKRKERDSKQRDKDHKSSSSSSSKHKSSSSSSSSSRKSSTRDKDSKESKSKVSSSSSSTDKKYNSSSSNSSSKAKSSSSSKTSSSSSSKHSSSDKISSKESSSSNLKTENSDLIMEDTSAIFATTEEDIMKECEMIYDQLEQEFASLHQTNAANENSKVEAEKEKESLKRKALDEEDALNAPSKKRVAYENADKNKSHMPVVVHKPDHRKNAMQAIFDRQDAIKRKHEEEAAAAAAALREAEEKVREANEALRKVKEKTLTPLVPKSYLTPPSKPIGRSMIAPVANIIALERAKKKVEELRAEKRPAFTPAQTSKAGSRVAHKITEKATATEATKQPKPPVLEANSTKISFNIRMQYYDMMVKHCLAMYPNTADAWERAQTEELAVFKKCNTPVIYKSSAMLAINKLRKEATDSGNKPSNANKLISHEVVLAGKLANNTSWSVQKKIKNDASAGGEPFDKLPSDKAYEMVYDLRLTEEQLVANGYPRSGMKPGTAKIQCTKPMRRPNDTERYCSRCGKVFNLQMYDEVCVDECNYHPKGTGYRRGFADNHHRCCQQPAGT
ncbi:RNA exonuclease 1 homolog, partial [Lucilia sericata]